MAVSLFSFSFSFDLGVRVVSQFIQSFILSVFYQRGRRVAGGSSANKPAHLEPEVL
jgi:hypothetical protein